MFDDVERADHVELHAESRLLKVPLYKRARSSSASKCQAFRKQIHPHNDPPRTRLLQAHKTLPVSTSYFQHSVTIGQILCNLFRECCYDPIPRAKPKMLAFDPG